MYIHGLSLGAALALAGREVLVDSVSFDIHLEQLM
jgi:hypothetical protein